jgi:iron(III) transport system substrate-binding protein
MTDIKRPNDARPKAFVLTVLVICLALVAAACGESGDETTTTAGSEDPGTTAAPETSEAEAAARAVYEEYAGISGAEREQSLAACALEAGGDVVVYTSNSAIDSIIDGFEEKFPDLAVNTYRATPAAFIQRFFAEQEAGYYGVDVVEDADVTLVTQSGLAGEYVNPELTDQIRGLDDVQGQFIPTRMGAFVVAWNTDAVDESEIPDTLEGFTDPKWAGRLSIADADWPWYMALYQDLEAEGRTGEEIDEIFATLASYASIVPSHTLQAQLLAAGEHDVGLTTFNHSVDLLREEGAPVTWKRTDGSAVEPIVFHQEGAVPVVNAPNPCGALLFIDYFLTGGQEIMASLFRPTSIPQGQEDLFEGNRQIFVPIDEYFNNRDGWEPTWLGFLEQGTAYDQ